MEIFDSKVKTMNLIFVILLLGLVVLSSLLGHYKLGFFELTDALLKKILGIPLEKNIDTVLFNVRFPRILAAIIVGGGLAMAGAVFQGVFRNPMVSPDLLGASSSAGFGAALGILLGLQALQIQVLSFLFGIIGVMMSWSIAKAISKKHGDTLTLVLTGLVVSSLFQAFISISKMLADPMNKLPAITFWLMGGLATVSMDDTLLLIIPVLIGAVPLFFMRWRINALSFGDEEARTMGMDVNKVRLVLIVCATLITSACVSVSGTIGWVGLIIPHLVRMMVGPDYKHVIPTSILIGSIFLVFVDNFSRAIFPVEVPLGILTSIIGAPFFIFLLLKERRKEN